jgi:16S rRNA (guanine527-N7)-methyltransferase
VVNTPHSNETFRTLLDGARALGLTLSPEELDRFARFQDMLLDWNQRMNLTAITAPTDVQVKHFLDSLTVLEGLPEPVRNGEQSARLLDVGAGAGFPGIPLAIVRPNLQVVLLEATQKKCRFLEHVVTALNLSNVQVVCGRAEEIAHRPDQRAAYDIVVARALANLATLAELCLPFARLGGEVIAPKKLGIEAEVVSAAKAINTLGGKLLPPLIVRLPILDEERQLIRIAKVRQTPATYPRRAGVPAKSPL